MEELIEQMRALSRERSGFASEDAPHIEADEILCTALRLMARADEEKAQVEALILAYEVIEKHYA